MGLIDSFARKQDSALIDEFMTNGYVICDADDRSALDALRHEVVKKAAELSELPMPADEDKFLNEFHKLLPIEKLNNVRLGLYRYFADQSWFRPTYFALGRSKLETLVGNELAMQNRINFSIQMPNDKTSLLDIHADVFSGETPYQVVQWIPLVNVSKSKSMFILPREKSNAAIAKMKEYGAGGMKALFAAVEKDLLWLDIPYGKILIFCPNFLHGNVINVEETTRWSMNVRFTGLFTPYVSPDKGIGSFYLPITPRPVTKLGMDYKVPGGFEE